MRTTGIRPDVPTQRRDLLTRRVGCVEEPVARGRAREIEVDNAGLDARATIARIDLEDAIQSREGDDDPAVGRDGTAAQTSSGTARDDRFAALFCYVDNLRDLTHIFW